MRPLMRQQANRENHQRYGLPEVLQQAQRASHRTCVCTDTRSTPTQKNEKTNDVWCLFRSTTKKNTHFQHQQRHAARRACRQGPMRTSGGAASWKCPCCAVVDGESEVESLSAAAAMLLRLQLLWDKPGSYEYGNFISSSFFVCTCSLYVRMTLFQR